MKNVSIGYLKPIVSNINLTFNPGELILLYGANGSGKTTLLKSIAGLVPFLDGDILYEQNSILSLPLIERSSIFSYCLTSQPANFLTLLEILQFTTQALYKKNKTFHKVYFFSIY